MTWQLGSGFTPIEWNSNSFVIQRTNQIIDSINRAKRDRNLSEAIDGIRDLYTEIVVDLSPTEKEIWQRIQGIIKLNNPSPSGVVTGYIINEGRLWAEIDNVDIELRVLAKKHGYLASNKNDPRRAITRR